MECLKKILVSTLVASPMCRIAESNHQSEVFSSRDLTGGVALKEMIVERMIDLRLRPEPLADEWELSRFQLCRKVSVLTVLAANEFIRKQRKQQVAQLLSKNWGPGPSCLRSGILESITLLDCLTMNLEYCLSNMLEYEKV